ncbi:MAG TPA: SH3 domain-containing protein [Candidatus Sulfotelmatobacter sp.]|nr:SH3 domain-containing protein [Candidatus Sulfotelmatobacter sp.]
MKRKLLVAVPLLCMVALLAWIFRPKHESLGEAYVSERTITLWSSIAQVREQMGVLPYGERVEVLARRNDNVKVRTAAGVVGWVEGRYLMDPDLWQRSAKLLQQAQSMSVQARGRTKVTTNLRVEPGRTEPRLYQFTRGTEVEIVGRAVADWVQVSDEKETPEGETSKKEDWFLVRGIATRPPGEGTIRNSAVMNTTQPGDQTIPIAGWLVARFVSLDIPDTVREYTTSANVRPIAWFELNRVTDPEGDHPQYLVAGTHSPEGQPCDFTTLRVYTWNPKKTRYETAYIENNLCGALPIQLGKGPKGEPEFRFHVMEGAKEERVYHLIQTVVRRVREERPKSSAARKSSKAQH